MTLINKAHVSFGLRDLASIFSAFLLLFFFSVPLLAASTTSTGLAITPSSPVAPGAVLTLTATVSSGGSPVGYDASTAWTRDHQCCSAVSGNADLRDEHLHGSERHRRATHLDLCDRNSWQLHVDGNRDRPEFSGPFRNGLVS